MTVACPHRRANALRGECPGCRAGAVEDLFPFCAGEASGTAHRDSDGDYGVIDGIRTFLAVEDLDLSCGCILTADEEQDIIDQLCESYVDDLESMAEDDARREAGF